MFRKFLMCLCLAVPVNAGTISVTGTASESVKPDVAYVTLEVVTTNVNAGVALKENNEKISKFLDEGCKLFHGPNGKKSKFETSNFMIEMQHDKNDYNKIVGFVVMNSISCTIHKDDLPLLGRFLAESINSGVNRISNLRFGVTNEELIMPKLRERALLNASKKAFIYAQTAGIKLRKAINISESSNVYIGNRNTSARYDAPGGGSVPISSGEETLSITVSVVFDTDTTDRAIRREPEPGGDCKESSKIYEQILKKENLLEDVN